MFNVMKDVRRRFHGEAAQYFVKYRVDKIHLLNVVVKCSIILHNFCKLTKLY